jgi:hypothetical protein
MRMKHLGTVVGQLGLAVAFAGLLFPAASQAQYGESQANDGCHISEQAPNTVLCTGIPYHNVGNDGSGSYRGLLRFPLEDPWLDTIELVSADLVQYCSPSGIGIAVHRVTTPWTGLFTGDPATRATWNRAGGSSSWLTPGGDFDATPAAETATSAGFETTWRVSDLVRAWISGAVPNYGLLVKATDESAQQVATCHSPSANETAPYLALTYRRPPVIGTPTGPLWTRRTQAGDHRQEGLYDKLYGVTVTATAGGSGVRTIAFSVVNSAGVTVISSPDPSPQSCSSLCSKTRGFTLDTDTVADGTYTIRVTASDQLGVSSSLSWTVTVDRRGDIYTADEHVNSQAWLAATDWAKLAPRYARRTAQTYIKTREPREVRVRTRATDYDSTDEEAFWVRRSDRDEDPNLEPVAQIINLRDRTNGAAWTTVETGSLVAALEPWQFAPPANGGQFERRQLVADGMIHDVWRDTATKLPVKRTVRDASNGSLFVTRFWSYAVGRMTDAEAPPDLFHVARPAVVGQEEEEDFTSVNPAAAMFVEDEETGATFRPRSLGKTVKLDSGDYCIAGTVTHHSRLFGESARGWDPEGDPLPDEDQGYPGRAAPSTRVDVYYVPRQGRRCKSQDDVVLDTPPIVVLSMAAESSEAAAWTGHFTREAQHATENPLARGGAFAGAEPVTLDSGPSMAYVIKSERSAQSSFLLRAGDTTVMVRGPLTADEVPGLATTMEAM